MLALLTGLPPDSALSRAVIGDSWTNETSLLAVIADRLGVIATGGKYALMEVPPQVPWPDGLKPEPTPVDPATLAAFFGSGS